jgi:hypothetical protein
LARVFGLRHAIVWRDYRGVAPVHKPEHGHSLPCAVRGIVRERNNDAG